MALRPHAAAIAPHKVAKMEKRLIAQGEIFDISGEAVEQIGRVMKEKAPLRWYTTIVSTVALFLAGMVWRDQAEWVEPVTVGLTAAILFVWVGFRIGFWFATNVCLEAGKRLRAKGRKLLEEPDA